MPTLHIFAICEKVIMDDNKNPSLIVLIQNINVAPVAPKEKLPRDAVTPKEWAIFTQWMLSEEEQEKPFVQVIQAFWPDGTQFNKTPHPFPTTKHAIKQVNMGVVGMPVGQEGPIPVKLWLELEDQPVTEVFVKHLNVIHQKEQAK